MNGWVSEGLIIEQRYFYSKRKEGRKEGCSKKGTWKKTVWYKCVQCNSCQPINWVTQFALKII